jgi:hypothetical protein
MSRAAHSRAARHRPQNVLWATEADGAGVFALLTATLAAVASGAIGLEQAAALVIGQNIGTTPTAVDSTAIWMNRLKITAMSAMTPATW